MRNNLNGSIRELKEILDKAMQESVCLNRNYLEDCPEKELHAKINLASMDLIFSYSRRLKNSQEDFENSFDVIRRSIELLRGSNLCESQIGRAIDLVNFAVKQENPELKIPYRYIEYLSGYI